MIVMALLSSALAAPPSIDTPVRTGATSPRDAGVVVGIEDYAFIPDVPDAERDAQAFHQVLLYSRGVPAEHLHLVVGAPSRERIEQEVARAAEEVEPGGTLWFYFAGHGAAEASDGGRLLLGVDVQSDLASFSARGLRVDELVALGERSGAERVVVVLDACYTGVGRSGEELLPGARFAIPTYAAGTARTVVWCAAGPDQVAGPHPGARHGAFTYSVVGALRGWADGEISGSPDGVVTLEEAEAWVERDLARHGVRDQQPVRDSPTGVGTWELIRGELEPAPESDPSTMRAPRARSRRALPWRTQWGAGAALAMPGSDDVRYDLEWDLDAYGVEVTSVYSHDNSVRNGDRPLVGPVLVATQRVTPRTALRLRVRGGLRHDDVYVQLVVEEEDGGSTTQSGRHVEIQVGLDWQLFFRSNGRVYPYMQLGPSLDVGAPPDFQAPDEWVEGLTVAPEERVVVRSTYYRAGIGIGAGVQWPVTGALVVGLGGRAAFVDLDGLWPTFLAELVVLRSSGR